MTVPLAGALPVDTPDSDDDPWTAMIGFGPTGVSAEPGEIDEVVYGP